MDLNFFLKVLDDVLQEKSKKYFLLKKINDYRNRLQYQRRISLLRIMQYEKKWNHLVYKYAQINIYGIEFVGIGETIPRLFMLIKDNRKKDKNVYNIVLPTFFPNYNKGVFNNKVFDIFERKIHFITEKNIDFWLYAVTVHSKKINIDDFDKYKWSKAIAYLNKDCKPIIPFQDDIKIYAQKRMRKMGIAGEYICLHARETLTKTNNYSNYVDTSVASVDINSFKQAVAYLNTLGYQLVRMGKDEAKPCKFEGVIDYTNDFYDEVMDFYLIANCKFLIGSPSGLTSVTYYWGRPVLITNLNVLSYGFESHPYTKYDLYIPKKFYSMRENRLLNLYETITLTAKCDRYDKNYKRRGITVIDNTEEEILMATIEMNEKLNHTWVITEEEKECMEKYWQIIDLWKSRHRTVYPRKRSGAEGYTMPPMPICYSYLKENMCLLDVEEIS